MSYTNDPAEPNEGNEMDEQTGAMERSSVEQLSASEAIGGVVMKPGPDCPVG